MLKKFFYGLGFFVVANGSAAFANPPSTCLVPNMNPGHQITQALNVVLGSDGKSARLILTDTDTLSHKAETPQEMNYEVEKVSVADRSAQIYAQYLLRDKRCAAVDGYGLLNTVVAARLRYRYVGVILTCEDASGKAVFTQVGLGFAVGNCQ